MRLNRSAGLALAVAIAASAQVRAARLDYNIGLTVEHNDNITLSEDNPASENILRPTLGFRLSEDGSAVQAYVDGILGYNDYLKGTFADEFRGQMTGRLNWSVLPQRLDLVFEDVLSVQPIDVLGANAPNNLQQINVFSLGPTFRFQLGTATRGLAELRYINSRAQETDFFDSQRLSAALRLIWDLDATSRLSANSEAEGIDFSDAGNPSYNRYSAYARYARASATFDSGIDLGVTQINGDEPIGDHLRPLVRANLGWHPSEVSTFALTAAHQYTDAASSMIDAADARVIPAAGAPIPTAIATGGAVVNANPYLEDLLDLSYVWRGTTASFGVAPFYRRSSYLDSTLDAGANDLDQNSRGLHLTANWLPRPLWNLGAFATYEKIDYRNLDRNDRNTLYGLFLINQLTRHWSWRLELDRNQRDSSAAGQSNSQNIIFVSVAYTR